MVSRVEALTSVTRSPRLALMTAIVEASSGPTVSRADLQPGDLVFFYQPISHVAMYIGNGQIVHAPTEGESVQVVALDSLGSFTTAVRPTG